ncbi:MAG: hypothetical protein ACI9A7_000653 [Cyclobacteriaceae bacterium]|jgi:hypothetical protein
MVDILIEATNVTPLVKIDSAAGKISFTGKSSPENAIEFFYPIINNILELFPSATNPITVDLAFRYFNTSSSKCLFDFFRALKKLQSSGKEIRVNWYYEEDDEDMLETGEDFADMLSFDFHFIEIEEITLKMAS